MFIWIKILRWVLRQFIIFLLRISSLLNRKVETGNDCFSAQITVCVPGKISRVLDWCTTGFSLIFYLYMTKECHSLIPCGLKNRISQNMFLIGTSRYCSLLADCRYNVLPCSRKREQAETLDLHGLLSSWRISCLLFLHMYRRLAILYLIII